MGGSATRTRLADPSTPEVTFVGAGEPMAIRMINNTVTTMCKAANTLDARYFIAVDGFDAVQNLPVWAVFDMRTAEKFIGTEWKIGMPVKTFTTETADAAIMWAVMMRERR